jgi:hypothetical protein
MVKMLKHRDQEAAAPVNSPAIEEDIYNNTNPTQPLRNIVATLRESASCYQQAAVCQVHGSPPKYPPVHLT